MLLIVLARPLLDRFGQVRCLDARATREIGDGARQLENVVIGAGAEADRPVSRPLYNHASNPRLSFRRPDTLNCTTQDRIQEAPGGLIGLS